MRGGRSSCPGGRKPVAYGLLLLLLSCPLLDRFNGHAVGRGEEEGWSDSSGGHRSGRGGEVGVSEGRGESGGP